MMLNGQVDSALFNEKTVHTGSFIPYTAQKARPCHHGSAIQFSR